MKMRHYLWSDYKVKRLRKPNRVKGSGGALWKPDPMEIKVGFWRNYRGHIVTSSFAGLASLGTFIVLVIKARYFFVFGSAAFIYFFMAWLGIISSIVLPIHWYREHMRMQRCLIENEEA